MEHTRDAPGGGAAGRQGGAHLVCTVQAGGKGKAGGPRPDLRWVGEHRCREWPCPCGPGEVERARCRTTTCVPSPTSYVKKLSDRGGKARALFFCHLVHNVAARHWSRARRGESQSGALLSGVELRQSARSPILARRLLQRVVHLGGNRVAHKNELAAAEVAFQLVRVELVLRLRRRRGKGVTRPSATATRAPGEAGQSAVSNGRVSASPPTGRLRASRAWCSFCGSAASSTRPSRRPCNRKRERVSGAGHSPRRYTGPPAAPPRLGRRRTRHCGTPGDPASAQNLPPRPPSSAQ